MFLNHLIARAEGTAPVLMSAPKLARELDDPAWSPAPETDPAEFEVAEPLPAGQSRSRPAGSPRQPRAAEPAPEAMPAAARPPLTVASSATTESLQGPASPQPDAARSTTPALEAPQLWPAAPLLSHMEPRTEMAPQDTAPAEAPPAATLLQTPPPAPQLSPEIMATLAPAPPSPALPHRRDAQPDPAATQTEPSERIEVHVEIGQLDLVSPPPPMRPAPNPQSRAARPGPDLSLNDYLERGRGNGR